MNRAELLRKLEEVINAEQGVLQADTQLEQYTDWDSMAFLSVITILDSEFHKKISLSDLRLLKTPNDIFNFIGLTS